MRRRPERIVTFAYGAHHCLGAALTRLAGGITLERLLERFPGFAVDPARGRYARGRSCGATSPCPSGRTAPVATRRGDPVRDRRSPDDLPGVTAPVQVGAGELPWSGLCPPCRARHDSEGKARMGELDGVSVIDLSRDLGGAYCARLLAATGATVTALSPLTAPRRATVPRGHVRGRHDGL